MMMPALVSQIHGSDAYVRFRYVLESLELAQDSITSLDGIDKPDNSQSIAVQLATMLTSMEDAQDNLKCASATMKMLPADNENDRTLKAAFIASFDLERKAISDSIVRAKSTMSSGVSSSTLDEAEFISSRTRMQKRAATELMQSTAFAVTLAIYTDDPAAKTTEYLKLNAEEYADVSQRVAVLGKKEKSAFTDCANLLAEPLSQHKPRY